FGDRIMSSIAVAAAPVRATVAVGPPLDHLSWSGIQTYRNCPRKFAYRYIERVPEEFVPAALAFGGSIHRAVERLHQARMETAAAVSTDELLVEYENG